MRSPPAHRRRGWHVNVRGGRHSVRGASPPHPSPFPPLLHCPPPHDPRSPSTKPPSRSVGTFPTRRQPPRHLHLADHQHRVPVDPGRPQPTRTRPRRKRQHPSAMMGEATVPSNGIKTWAVAHLTNQLSNGTSMWDIHGDASRLPLPQHASKEALASVCRRAANRGRVHSVQPAPII